MLGERASSSSGSADDGSGVGGSANSSSSTITPVMKIQTKKKPQPKRESSAETDSDQLFFFLSRGEKSEDLIEGVASNRAVRTSGGSPAVASWWAWQEFET